MQNCEFFIEKLSSEFPTVEWKYLHTDKYNLYWGNVLQQCVIYMTYPESSFWIPSGHINNFSEIEKNVNDDTKWIVRNRGVSLPISLHIKHIKNYLEIAAKTLKHCYILNKKDEIINAANSCEIE